VAALTEGEVLTMLRETGALLEGHFLLSSGLHSARYIQCARLLQYPELAARVGEALAERARFLGPMGAVVGPALGGILVAHEVARALGVRAMFTERENNVMTLRRGFELQARERVLIAEDVITTGRSSLEVAEVVHAQGARVVGSVSIVDRRAEEGSLPWPVISLVKLHIENHAPEACPLCRQGLPLVKPGSRAQP